MLWWAHHDGGSTFKTVGELVCAEATGFKTETKTKIIAAINLKAETRSSTVVRSPIKSRDHEGVDERVTSSSVTRFGFKVRQAFLIRPTLPKEAEVDDQFRLPALL